MFIARLFGFVVVIVFIGAIALSLVSTVKLDKFNLSKVSDDSVVLEDSVNEVESKIVVDDDLPEFFESDVRGIPLRSVQIKTLSELRSLIYKEGAVLVILNNEILKNPFVEKKGMFKVVLNGFNQTHLFSTGEEVSDNSFVYLNEDFMKAYLASGSLIWVFN